MKSPNRASRHHCIRASRCAVVLAMAALASSAARVVAESNPPKAIGHHTKKTAPRRRYRLMESELTGAAAEGETYSDASGATRPRLELIREYKRPLHRFIHVIRFSAAG